MLSHDNVTWASHAIIMHHEEQQYGEFEESGVSYLPLSHIAGQLFDIHIPMRIAAQSKGNFVVWYDEPGADVLAQVAEVRPTFFMV
jgi:long-chain-fatty-acid--CoA ligase ACSBG